MKITQHTAVSIHYRLTNAKGELIESSFEAEPMLYLHGAENMIPGLEAALEGKSAGDKLDVNVDSEQAYGPYHDGLKQEVPISAFGDIEDIVPGMRFIAETEMGQRPVQVTAVNDDTVTVDGNHPLAGQSLAFSVEVLEVRAATEEEIAHGHIHAPGSSCGSHEHSHEGGCCGGEGHDHQGGCCSDNSDEPAKEGCDGNGGCGCKH
ncbi:MULTISPECIES: peptidylprolyl isomerase [Shewanella]|uniref:peptidylprolyl isomerase n=1 Tax=Shewanella TaxID=22 RepID=UPI00048C93AB|nr:MULTISPECIES: peptidylprolyl isomerase [Shewanella]QLE84620.1 peptidylprolyl isomerase [Shewanella sp. Scap07]